MNHKLIRPFGRNFLRFACSLCNIYISDAAVHIPIWPVVPPTLSGKSARPAHHYRRNPAVDVQRQRLNRPLYFNSGFDRRLYLSAIFELRVICYLGRFLSFIIRITPKRPLIHFLTIEPPS